VTDPYSEIAHHFPNEVAIGGALITMVEPNPGREHAYNRWYEDDHFYSGAMQGPNHHGDLAASGLGRLRFSGCFVPTVVGSDRYVGELR
jgi:hypothetical protein